MAVHKPTRETMTRGGPQAAKAQAVPAPIRGIDARTILSAADVSHCIYCYNLTPGEYGLKVRPGYREWHIDLTLSTNYGVGTLIPFGGVDDVLSDDRLFAVSNEGIWNVTLEGGANLLLVDFSLEANGGDTTALAGFGNYTQFVTDADEQLLFYADSRNGLFVYSATTEAWTRPAITGVDVTKVNFVMSHKNQLWFVERDNARAWYLPAGAIAGPAAAFHFGGSFKHGGSLAGLFTWTVDGGEGVDDYFIVVSRSGDVLTYKGTDPSSAEHWGMTGQYYIGAVPEGNRFAATQGGSLLLLSVYGLISVGDLIQGVDGKNIAAETETQKIATIIRRHMANFRSAIGWEVRSVPSLGALIISSPPNAYGVYIQYVMDATTGGWGLWRDVPMLCFAEWGGRMYFGAKDGRVMISDVPVDNALLEPEEGVINGEAIAFSILTTYQNYGEPALLKRGKHIRPQFISPVRPNVTALFRYDYDLSEILNTETGGLPTDSLWNVGAWDSAAWASTLPIGWHPVRGGWGMGRAIAIATTGNARAETTLVGWDVIWDSGGPL